MFGGIIEKLERIGTLKLVVLRNNLDFSPIFNTQPKHLLTFWCHHIGKSSFKFKGRLNESLLA